MGAESAVPATDGAAHRAAAAAVAGGGGETATQEDEEGEQGKGQTMARIFIEYILLWNGIICSLYYMYRRSIPYSNENKKDDIFLILNIDHPSVPKRRQNNTKI